MTRAMAVFQVGDQEESLHMLGAGEQIGRSELAALCLDDPRISEAHAMVSLRGKGLKLLALRGRFRVGAEEHREITLESGLDVELAPGLFVTCVEVILPERVLAIEFGALPRLIPLGTTTFYTHPRPRIKHGYDPDGEAILWALGEHWRVQVMETGEVLALDAEHAIALGTTELRTCYVSLEEMAYSKTRTSLREVKRIEVSGDRVKVWRQSSPGKLPVLISGVPGRICAAVIKHEHAASVQEIIDAVWPGDASLEHTLRKRFDTGLKRLRVRLEQLGFGADVLELDGAGTLILKIPRAQTQVLPASMTRGQDGSLR